MREKKGNRVLLLRRLLLMLLVDYGVCFILLQDGDGMGVVNVRPTLSNFA